MEKILWAIGADAMGVERLEGFAFEQEMDFAGNGSLNKGERSAGILLLTLAEGNPLASLLCIVPFRDRIC